MLLVAESALSSPVSVLDVSVYFSPSCNNTPDRYRATRNDFVVPQVPAKCSVAMRRVLFTWSDIQGSDSVQRRIIVGQPLAHRCKTFRSILIGYKLKQPGNAKGQI